MRIRTIGVWLGLSAISAVLIAAPPPQVVPARPEPPRSAPAKPGPQLAHRIGAAPKQSFQSGGQTYKINPKQPGVAAVRLIPPNAYEPKARSKSVASFYNGKLLQPAVTETAANNSVTREKLNHMKVGPYRHEFVWWAWNYWDRADWYWWAWNNRAYFDSALWTQWMLDQTFAEQMAQFNASGKQPILGLIPDKEAGESAEVIYSDDYIEAVYNPQAATPPSIVVDCTAGVQLNNLLEGAPRVSGKKPKTIGSLSDKLYGFQFVSLPENLDPTYEITVKRDCNLYVFGPTITAKDDAFGKEADKWTPETNKINGQGIQFVYRRKVITGEKVHLHGTECSIASEQIELYSPATRDAVLAAKFVVRDLDKITKNQGAFLLANSTLENYVEEAHDAADQLITPNGNVNDDAVADCHYVLSVLLRKSEAEVAKANNASFADARKEFVDRIKSIQQSLNDVDELRDPSLDQPVDGSQTETLPQHPEAAASLAKIDLLKLFDAANTNRGSWSLGTSGLSQTDDTKWTGLNFPYMLPAEYDLTCTFKRTAGNDGLWLFFTRGKHALKCTIGEGGNTKLTLGVPKTDPAVTQTAKSWLINGNRYTSIIKVRNDGVEVFLDGKSVAIWKTDYRDLTTHVVADGDSGIGFGMFRSAYTIESASVTEISVAKTQANAAPAPVLAPTKEALVGTWDHTCDNGWSGTVTYHRDGTCHAEGSIGNQRKGSLDGTWRIERNSIEVKWNDWLSNAWDQFPSAGHMIGTGKDHDKIYHAETTKRAKA